MSFRRNLVRHWQNLIYTLSTFHLGFSSAIKPSFFSLLRSVDFLFPLNSFPDIVENFKIDKSGIPNCKTMEYLYLK
jgi:hypothetical protein